MVTKLGSARWWGGNRGENSCARPVKEAGEGQTRRTRVLGEGDALDDLVEGGAADELYPIGIRPAQRHRVLRVRLFELPHPRVEFFDLHSNYKTVATVAVVGEESHLHYSGLLRPSPGGENGRRGSRGRQAVRAGCGPSRVPARERVCLGVGRVATIRRRSARRNRT